MQGTKSILLVEDDDIDAMKIERAFREIGIRNQLIRKTNGQEALLHLRDQSDLPCAILLDLKMPVMNGIELLKIIKADDVLKMIPVIVLTTSEDQKDKVDSFDLGVAGYILKQPDYQKFCETMRTIYSYWSVSELPGSLNSL